MKTVYVISKTGPEWSHPVEVHECKKKAKERKFELNQALDEKDPIDSQSAHTIADLPFVELVDIKEIGKRIVVLKRNIKATLTLEKITRAVLDQNEEWALELMKLEAKVDEYKSSK
ncbi:MAG: hypothetical protein KUG81_04115 [Gammaproteobacteria bacterium]|nr:hypothetical protein [Gammaproteobacteria bacterium]